MMNLHMLDIFEVISELCEQHGLDERKIDVSFAGTLFHDQSKTIYVVYRDNNLDVAFDNGRNISLEEVKQLRHPFLLHEILEPMIEQIAAKLSETGAVT